MAWMFKKMIGELPERMRRGVDASDRIRETATVG
jgi:hypothetical protein